MMESIFLYEMLEICYSLIKDMNHMLKNFLKVILDVV